MLLLVVLGFDVPLTAKVIYGVETVLSLIRRTGRPGSDIRFLIN